MTARQLYEYILIELNKVQAPVLLLEDFNYFANKTINAYINKIYNNYDINQQKTDDLRVLKSTAILTPTLSTNYSVTSLLEKTYEVNLPDDYLHILNCVVEYSLATNYKCYTAGQKIHFGAKRLTADMYPQLIRNYYMKPKYNNPYFYINNIASDTVYPINEVPINVVSSTTYLDWAKIEFGTPGASTISIVKNGTTYTYTYNASVSGALLFSDITSLRAKFTSLGITSTIEDTNLILNNLYTQLVTSISETGTYLTITTQSNDISIIEKVAGYRYGNKSKVRMEVRYGSDNSTFVLNKIYVDYIRSPQFVRLIQEQLDLVSDTSQILEFPDYVCQEILNDLIRFTMENGSDPRLQTNIPVNQSIAIPSNK